MRGGRTTGRTEPIAGGLCEEAACWDVCAECMKCVGSRDSSVRRVGLSDCMLYGIMVSEDVDAARDWQQRPRGGPLTTKKNCRATEDEAIQAPDKARSLK